jgi:hypothetical protein
MFKESDGIRADRLERENLALRISAQELVDPSRIMAWLAEKPRRPASTAFTAGVTRNLARSIEDVLLPPG